MLLNIKKKNWGLFLPQGEEDGKKKC